MLNTEDPSRIEEDLLKEFEEAPEIIFHNGNYAYIWQ